MCVGGGVYDIQCVCVGGGGVYDIQCVCVCVCGGGVYTIFKDESKE